MCLESRMNKAAVDAPSKPVFRLRPFFSLSIRSLRYISQSSEHNTSVVLFLDASTLFG